MDFSEFKAKGWPCGNVRVSQSADLECNPELARGLRFVDLGQFYSSGFSTGTPIFLQKQTPSLLHLAVMLCTCDAIRTGNTEEMLIRSHAFVGPMRPVMFGNSYIDVTTKSTCLGKVIDYKLNGKPQIKSLQAKFGGKLNCLKKRKGLPPRVLIKASYYLLHCHLGMQFIVYI